MYAGTLHVGHNGGEVVVGQVDGKPIHLVRNEHLAKRFRVPFRVRLQARVPLQADQRAA